MNVDTTANAENKKAKLHEKNDTEKSSLESRNGELSHKKKSHTNTEKNSNVETGRTNFEKISNVDPLSKINISKQKISTSSKQTYMIQDDVEDIHTSNKETKKSNPQTVEDKRDSDRKGKHIFSFAL